MLHFHGVEDVRHAALAESAGADRLGRQPPGSVRQVVLIDDAAECLLLDVPHVFVRSASDDDIDSAVIASAFPPAGVEPGQMDRHFGGGGARLADPVGRENRPLCLSGARLVLSDLPRVRAARNAAGLDQVQLPELLVAIDRIQFVKELGDLVVFAHSSESATQSHCPWSPSSKAAATVVCTAKLAVPMRAATAVGLSPSLVLRMEPDPPVTEL